LDGIIDGEYFPFPSVEKSEIVAFKRGSATALSTKRGSAGEGVVSTLKKASCERIAPSTLALSTRSATQPALKPKNVSAFDRWVGGEYPVVPALEEVFNKVENKDKLAKCVICGRILTNPVSVAIEIGPECRQRISNAEYIVDDGSALKVTKALREASTLYHEKKYRDWIIRAVLTQGAPLPMKVLRSPWNGKKQYWGYKNKPLLYYLDIDNQLHYVDVCRRQLRYRAVTKETALTELDSRALACLSDSTL
jgi:hypothetical protein